MVDSTAKFACGACRTRQWGYGLYGVWAGKFHTEPRSRTMTSGSHRRVPMKRDFDHPSQDRNGCSDFARNHGTLGEGYIGGAR